MSKNCFSDREKTFEIDAEGREFAKFLRSLGQFIRTEKGQTNFCNRMLFKLFLKSAIRTIIVKIENNNWVLEICRES